MKIKINPKEETKVPSKLVEYKEGVKFLIAGINKPSFQHLLELRGTQVNQEIGGWRPVTDESATEFALSHNKAASHLILNWQGIYNEETGEIFEYSKENAELLCTSSEESIPLTAWILDEARKIQTEADNLKIDTLGKSLDSTNGSDLEANQKPKNTTKSKKPLQKQSDELKANP